MILLDWSSERENEKGPDQLCSWGCAIPKKTADLKTRDMSIKVWKIYRIRKNSENNTFYS